MQLSIKADIKAAERALGTLKKQVPFAAAFAMTKIGQKVKAAELGHMKGVFRNVSRYTRGALYLKRAEKKDFESGRMKATVWVIGDPRPGEKRRHYLYPNIRGGQRDHGGFERILIRRGLMSSDEYLIKGKYIGKITKGWYQKMLAQLQAYDDVYQRATNSTRSRKNRRGMEFFIDRGSKPAGIWVKRGKRKTPVFIFAKHARYSPRFNFFGVANKVTERNWRREFNKAISYAIKTAK